MQHPVAFGYRGVGELAALPVLKAHEQFECLAAILGDEQIERRTTAPVLFDRVADKIYLPVPGEHKVNSAVVVRHLRAVSPAPGLALVGRIAAVYPAARGSCEHMHISVLALPQGRLNHRDIKASECLRRHGAHALPCATVVVRDINKADPERIPLVRGGRYDPAAPEPYRLILDGSSAAAYIARHKLGGLAPIDAVIRERKICFPHRYLLADLEKEHDFPVRAPKKHRVPVRDISVRADPDRLAPSAFAAHARQDIDIVGTLFRAGKPCDDDSAVVQRQNGRGMATLSRLVFKYKFLQNFQSLSLTLTFVVIIIESRAPECQLRVANFNSFSNNIFRASNHFRKLHLYFKISLNH